MDGRLATHGASAASVDAVLDRCVDVLAHAPSALASDFDGTLSPITYPPEAAAILPGVQEALRRLAARLDVVAVISGRPVGDLVDRVAVPAAIYVGNHGIERWRDGVALVPATTAEERVSLAAARDAMEDALSSVPGVLLEDKNLGFAVHYRDVERPDLVRSQILKLAARLSELGLAAREGKRVFEIRFVKSPTKGTSVEWLVQERGLGGIVFIGDDHTDADAFRALRQMRERGGVDTLAVAVLGPETPAVVRESADVALSGPAAVADLIIRLADDPRIPPSPSPSGRGSG